MPAHRSLFPLTFAAFLLICPGFVLRVLRAVASVLLLSSTGAAVTVSMRMIAMQTKAAIVLRPAIKVTHKISLYCSLAIYVDVGGFDKNFSKIVFVGSLIKSFTRIDKDLLGKLG